jgi:hypothetical protein
VQRLALLYQIQNWREENSVILAEWIIENYQFEEMSMIENVLRRPPMNEDRHGDIETNWRLTPDTIRKWMSEALEDATTQREQAQEKFKLSEKNAQPLSVVDYDAFRKRLAEGNALKEDKPAHWSKDEAYLKMKAERAIQAAKQQPKND